MTTPAIEERTKTKEGSLPWDKVLDRIEALVEDVTALRDEIAHHISSPSDVVEWASRICAAIENESLTDKERRQIVKSVPPTLRHAVAAECYRTSENVTFGWVAAIAGVYLGGTRSAARSRRGARVHHGHEHDDRGDG